MTPCQPARRVTFAMSDWGRTQYGDPCRACGFDWSITLDDAISLVVKVPVSYRTALATASGQERHSEQAWSVTDYVCHVADNLRIWAERLGGVASGAPREVAPYDQDALAAARRYDEVALQAALWSLGRGVADWQLAIAQAIENRVTLVHSERGELTVLDVVRSNAHDCFHHLWDVGRSFRT